MKIQNTPINVLLDNTSKQLKGIKEITPPEWAKFVKTSAARERPPVEKDWWYARAASILRKLYIYGPIGVNKLKRKYGGKKNRGHKPERYYKGSGKIIRTILQQLEKTGLIEKTKKDSHHGRILTSKGKSLLDKKWQETPQKEKKSD
ncbi:30S ribosomal protein S19e [archaeon]|nr:30S ribosomal protein S19e [archaeon]